MTTNRSTSLSRALLVASLLLVVARATAQSPPPGRPPERTGDSASPAAILKSQDWPALRAWFHRPEFNVVDELTTYSEDHRATWTPGREADCATCVSDAGDRRREPALPGGVDTL